MSREQKYNSLEVLLWSIALPGFGQILNGHIFKGILLVALEFLVNVQANFNEVIISSFQGNIAEAIIQTDYQWLMFYPCLYMFAMWDAFKAAGGGKTRFSFLPFVAGAFFNTVGLIYSSNIRISGYLLGPMWLPMLFCIIGLAMGYLLQFILNRWVIG